MTTITCEYCRTKNEAGASECLACGRPLVDGAAREEPSGATEQPPNEREEVERWLSQLPEFTNSDAEQPAGEDESLPVWLQAVRAQADDLTDEEADELMAFLHDLGSADVEVDSEAPDEQAAAQAKITEELPDWVAALAPDESSAEQPSSPEPSPPEPSPPEPSPPEPSPGGESEEVRLPGTQPLEPSVELEGIPEQLAGEELPEWLADQPSAQAPDEPAGELPEWPAKSPGRPIVAADERTPQAPPGEEIDLEAGLQDALDEVQAALLESEQADQEPTSEDAGAQSPAASDRVNLERALAAALNLQGEESAQEHVDQWLDLLEDLPSAEDPDQLEQLMIDSDIEGADVPDWLRALRLQQAGGRTETAEDEAPETTGPFAGLSGILPAAALAATGEVRRTTATLEMSKEQRQQAALLRQLTMIEPERAPADDSAGEEPFLAARTILGLVLLVVIALGWLLPAIGDFLPWTIEPTAPPAAEGAWQAIEANGGQTALVAFEYTPAMAGELDSVAAVVLDHLAQNGSHVLTVSQIAAGVPVAEVTAAEIQDLQSTSLGYLPGEATGLRALGVCLVEPCESLAGRKLTEEQQNALADVGLIVVLSADRDSLVGWVEQVGTQTDTMMIAGVTQAMAPVANPYLASDQFAGLIEGMPVAAAYADTYQVNDGVSAEHLTSLTLAQWLVIVALLAGAIYFGLAAQAATSVTQAAKK